MDKQKRKKLKTAAKGYAFIGINLIGVLIFWTVPMLFSFIISISKWDFSKGFKGIKIVGFPTTLKYGGMRGFALPSSITLCSRLAMW